ncbi:MAG: ATP-binding protein, partial [Bifidobacteriaceae bacterium]|nr:ATP-binding protein [Bifidobacteriaceae bacterium]
MRRKIIDDLIKWKNNDSRRPLVLEGARQVGKTYIVEEFGKKHYKDFIRFNLDTEEDYSFIFRRSIRPEKIIQEIEGFLQKRIDPKNTLIFFDEIQGEPRALTALKYFNEEAPEYHIIAAGSLLGVAINRGGFNFPVGKINSLTLRPFSFQEFLWETNPIVEEEIGKCTAKGEKLSPNMHNLAMQAFKQYLIVGGLPTAIKEFIKTKSYEAAGLEQDEIIKNYINDMSKYSSSSDAVKIQSVYKSIPGQLAKENHKFQYSKVQQGATRSRFEIAIDWLLTSGMLLKCDRLKKPLSPIFVYKDSDSFKLYMHDVGILTRQSKNRINEILHFETIDNIFYGTVAENYVACALEEAGIYQLYWKSKYDAEIDFVIEDEILGTVPIEVKKGFKTKSKSLSVYDELFHPEHKVRLSSKNFGEEGSLISVPIYATEYWLKNMKEKSINYIDEIVREENRKMEELTKKVIQERKK